MLWGNVSCPSSGNITSTILIKEVLCFSEVPVPTTNMHGITTQMVTVMVAVLVLYILIFMFLDERPKVLT